MTLMYAKPGDRVVYKRRPELYGVMTVARLEGKRVACIVDGQVFGESFDRDELRPPTYQEKQRAEQARAAAACGEPGEETAA